MVFWINSKSHFSSINWYIHSRTITFRFNKFLFPCTLIFGAPNTTSRAGLARKSPSGKTWKSPFLRASFWVIQKMKLKCERSELIIYNPGSSSVIILIFIVFGTSNFFLFKASIWMKLSMLLMIKEVDASVASEKFWDLSI